MLLTIRPSKWFGWQFTLTAMFITTTQTTLIAANRMLKPVAIGMMLWLTAATRIFCQSNPGDGIYMIVNYVPRECKTVFDGYQRVTKDGKCPVAFTKNPIAIGKDLPELRENLIKSIFNYSRRKFPKIPVFPDVTLISETDVARAGKGVIVMGQVRRPGPISLKEELTLWQAVQGVGGCTEFGTMSHVALIRDRKIIDCNMLQADFRNLVLKPGDAIHVAFKCFVAESIYTLR